MSTIRSFIVACGALTAMGAPGEGNTVTGGELAERALCTSCHASNERLAAPAFHDIAMKYARMPGAEAYMVAKIKKVWINANMPRDARLTDAELWQLADWIMSHADCDARRRPSGADCRVTSAGQPIDTR